MNNCAIKYRFLSCSILFLFLTINLHAQSNQKIALKEYKEVAAMQFITDVELKFGCQFYFEMQELDSLTISINEGAYSLKEVLLKTFYTKGLQFAIDGHNNIFLSKKFQIQTELADRFFEKNIKNINQEKQLTLPEISKTEKGPLKVSIEQKLFEIGSKSNTNVKSNVILVGYVRDRKNGEAISGATVFVDNSNTKVVTDQFGYYALRLPIGRYTLRVSSMGMKDTKRELQLYSEGSFSVEMEEYIASLKAVVVSTERKSNLRGTQMGLDKVSIKTIKQLPSVLGESDVLRVVLTLPGVTSVGEASTGFNVRGGAADQNLILLNDATIYNPSHLFGFFSAFNADVIKNVELYKSAIPEKYGGRLSSVLDVSTRDGNSKKISGSGGIGLLTSRLTLEGPIKNEQTSFIISGRTTYSNWILQQIPDEAYKNSKASFYDLNLQVTHQFDAKNSLFITGYLSNDDFRLNKDTTYQYGNKNLIAKWKHIFNNHFLSVLSVGTDKYGYHISSTEVPLNAFKLSFNISQSHLKYDFNYNPSNKHSFNFGLNAVHYQLEPGTLEPNTQSSLVKFDKVQKEQALESAIYFGDNIKVNNNLTVNLGLRYTVFNYLGAHMQYQYLPGQPKQENSIIDSIQFSAGKNIKTYHGPEFRFSMRYSLKEDASLKLSFNSLRQYIHTLSNTTAISPTDIWKLSDPNIAPQQGYQASLGYYKNLLGNQVELSFEIYYKWMQHYLDYKSGASLIMNKHIETELINTKGEAYGAEFMIKKSVGNLNGWISYTYSRTFLKMDDPLAGESINHGEKYPASYDKPHNINLIGNYQFSHRLSLSLNGVYSTGRPITLPIAVFYQSGAQRVLYSDRNQYRIPDYIRADVSVNLEGNHKIKKLAHSSWSMGIYNVFARQNPYSVYFVQENGLVKGYQLSIFATAIPFITYNFKF
jgi:hypothetical protein